MRILITAATAAEIMPAQEIWETLRNQPSCNLQIETAITGVGSTTTAYYTLKALSSRIESPCDLAINIGISGSFCESLSIGSVVRIVSDFFGDCGIQTASGFQSLFEARLIDADTFPFASGKLTPAPLSTQWESALAFIPVANGVTVQNLVEVSHHTHPQLLAQIETMEGAAFFYVCMNERIPCIALRAVSNRVGERDKNRWNIPLALTEMRKTLACLLYKL